MKIAVDGIELPVEIGQEVWAIESGYEPIVGPYSRVIGPGIITRIDIEESGIEYLCNGGIGTWIQPEDLFSSENLAQIEADKREDMP